MGKQTSATRPVRPTHGLTIHTFTVGILMLLEEIGHPSLSGNPENLTDTANAVYIFADPAAAKSSLLHGVDCFRNHAFEFCLREVPASALREISDEIRLQIAQTRAQKHG